MRYTRPINGEKRARKVFLFFPLEINGEVRWLEKATFTQEYQRPSYAMDGSFVPGIWMNMDWQDLEDENDDVIR